MLRVHLVRGVCTGDTDRFGFGCGFVKFRDDIVFLETEECVQFAVFDGIFAIGNSRSPVTMHIKESMGDVQFRVCLPAGSVHQHRKHTDGSTTYTREFPANEDAWQLLLVWIKYVWISIQSLKHACVDIH